MRRIAASLLVSLLLLACPTSAFATWTRLSSEHFVFIGDVPERDLKHVAGRLELFRDAIARIFPGRALSSPVPTVVIVFRDERSFAPFRPYFGNRPLPVAGFATSSIDTNYIAVNAAQEPHASAIIFHEYAHLFFGQAFGTVPLWLNEGLAEFFATFEPRQGGASAVVGLAGEDNLRVLKSASRLFTLRELAAIDHESPVYNDGERRDLFYAQSWALVHYLLLGGQETADRLPQLLAQIVDGVSGAEAVTRVLGDDTTALALSVSRHASRKALPAMRLTFEQNIAARPTSPGEVLADPDAASYLGDALAHIGRIDAARAYLTAAVDRVDTTPRAIASLGLLEMREGRVDAGGPLLERALRLLPTLPAAQRWYARALLQMADRAGVDGPAFRARARLALAQALELEPAYAPSIAALARAELDAAGGASTAAVFLEILVERTPERDDYRLMLGEALVAQGDYKGASAQLGPLLARASNPGTRTAARVLLARMAVAHAATRDP